MEKIQFSFFLEIKFLFLEIERKMKNTFSLPNNIPSKKFAMNIEFFKMKNFLKM